MSMICHLCGTSQEGEHERCSQCGAELAGVHRLPPFDSSSLSAELVEATASIETGLGEEPALHDVSSKALVAQTLSPMSAEAESGQTAEAGAPVLQDPEFAQSAGEAQPEAEDVDGASTLPPGDYAFPQAMSLSFPGKIPAILRWSDERLNRSAAVIGIIVGGLFALAASHFSPRGSMVGRMLDLRTVAGVIPLSITLMFFWGAAICLLRWSKLRALGGISRASLVTEAAQQLSAAGLAQLMAWLDLANRDLSPLLRRMRAVLRQWKLRAGIAEADLTLQHEHLRDEERIRAGYQMVRTFVWAMPVIGLMGTVVGISLAVGGFAQFLAGNVEEVSAIKTSLVGVTNGLSFAFLMTLQGLLGALLLMLPATALQTREETFLASLEHDLCVHFLPELQRVAPATPFDAKTLEKAMRRALAVPEPLLIWQQDVSRFAERALESIGQAGTEIGQRVFSAIQASSESWTTDIAKVLDRQEALATDIASATRASHEESSRLCGEVVREIAAAGGEIAEHFETRHVAEMALSETAARRFEAAGQGLATHLERYEISLEESIARWHDETPRIDAYLSALQSLVGSLDRIVAAEADLQHQITRINSYGTLVQTLDGLEAALRGLQPFLKRLTGSFHLVPAPIESSIMGPTREGRM